MYKYDAYVAGSSKGRLDFFRPLIERMNEKGLRVYDWTRDPGWDREPTPTVLREAAFRDLEAIRKSHIFVYVVTPEKSEGAATELGYAMGREKKIVIVGEDTSLKNLFLCMATEFSSMKRVDNCDEMIEYVSSCWHSGRASFP